MLTFFYIIYAYFLLFLRQKKPEKFEPEYTVPEDKPKKCVADQKTSDTGICWYTS